MKRYQLKPKQQAAVKAMSQSVRLRERAGELEEAGLLDEALEVACHAHNRETRALEQAGPVTRFVRYLASEESAR